MSTHAKAQGISTEPLQRGLCAIAFLVTIELRASRTIEYCRPETHNQIVECDSNNTCCCYPEALHLSELRELPYGFCATNRSILAAASSGLSG